MFLRQLTITTGSGDLIREVKFKKGFNLILGEKNEDPNSSTNNLGKTTLTRVIDFCLAGKINQLYTDQEFNTINKEVLSYIQNNNPIFKLFVSKTFESDRLIEIKRVVNLNKKTKRISNFINNEPILDKNFQNNLKFLFFSLSDAQPSFRQLIPKFIRKDEQQISMILKFIHSHATNIEYEKVHLVLFDFSDLEISSQKLEIEKCLKGLENKRNALGNENEKNALEQKINIINDEIIKLKKERNEFKISEKYEQEEKQLTNIQNKIIKLDTNISELNLTRSISIDRLTEFDNIIKENSVDPAVEYLYKEVNLYMDNLQKTYEDLVTFHSSMLKNEISFLNKRIEAIDEDLPNLKKQKEDLMREYNVILEKLGKTGSLYEFTKLNTKIEDKSQELGKFKGIFEKMDKLDNEILIVRTKLNEINIIIESFENKLKSNITLFNKSFTSFTDKIYNEKYLLAYEDRKDQNDLFKFKIENMDGNLSSGKKQSLVTAFDLAYIQFCNDASLKYPLFVLNDKAELIDIDKYKTIMQITDNLNGQFIVPFIYDKIAPIYDSVKDDIILKLSEDNKFFNF